MEVSWEKLGSITTCGADDSMKWPGAKRRASISGDGSVLMRERERAS
jgi:hypothetical protein